MRWGRGMTVTGDFHMIKRRTVLAAAGGALLGSALATGTARADATIAINPGTEYGSWEGWGTSLAWWANVFGARDDFADIFFTTKSVVVQRHSAARPRPEHRPLQPGRVQLEHRGRRDHGRLRQHPRASSRSRATGRTGTTRTRPPRPGTGRPTPTSARRWSRRRARRTSASCSPTRPCGGCASTTTRPARPDGGNNLQSWNYRQHASHLAAVALYAKNNWGVNFATVDAVQRALLQLVDGDRHPGGLPHGRHRPGAPSSRTCAASWTSGA